MAANCYLINTLDGQNIYIADCASVQDALAIVQSLTQSSDSSVESVFSLRFTSESDSTTSSCVDAINTQSTPYVFSKIRSQLLQMSKPSHYISMVYRETLRSMINKFTNLVYRDGKDDIREVKCYHGNPERAIAKYFQENNIILPVVTISQTSTETDSTRLRYTPMLVQEKYWNPDSLRAVRILSFAPNPVSILYSVNVWAKYNIDMDQILEQIRLIFNPSTEIETPFSTLTKAFIVSEEDLSETQVGDGSDRIIKKAILVEVQTYIPNPKYMITSTGKIETFNLEATLCEN